MTAPPRRLILLGSTGSIGRSALEVVEHLAQLGERFEVVGLAAGGNAALLFEQAQRFGTRELALAEAQDAGGALPGTSSSTHRLRRGADAALRLVEEVARPGDLVVGAIVGAAGLAPTIAALERRCDVALANKETLVAAGALVMPLAKARGCAILPVDSEHSAIFQCLRGLSAADQIDTEVRRVVLTASGGPFRTWSAERMRTATVEEALNHPTWSMGSKVTIDSASMMNKALEMIEARWLFDLDAGRIDAIIHPQSIVHSFVEFVDGSVIAQLSPPDMKLPIQHALTHPRRVEGIAARLPWERLARLDFEPADPGRFPAVRLARIVLERGGSAGALFNAANEVAVAAFLAGEIQFGRIAELVEQALETVPTTPVGSLADVMAADAAARRAVADAIGRSAEEPLRPARR
ncbi:MAG TPA: 1-deoxy-D-xylulose-5-phosphate reductoisomerase [Phycisphaerales bacterium]|nr:1-deoxy-D-xylulose-5-phosphate reductoisomerase [Phycisphaerales bacterium]HMP38001.1 1-deoxy-D-xylulose-5-phosphate reductoisomerase [Phycisphaerales bacterium]